VCGLCPASGDCENMEHRQATSTHESAWGRTEILNVGSRDNTRLVCRMCLSKGRLYTASCAASRAERRMEPPQRGGQTNVRRSRCPPHAQWVNDKSFAKKWNRPRMRHPSRIQAHTEVLAMHVNSIPRPACSNTTLFAQRIALLLEPSGSVHAACSQVPWSSDHAPAQHLPLQHMAPMQQYLVPAFEARPLKQKALM